MSFSAGTIQHPLQLSREKQASMPSSNVVSWTLSGEYDSDRPILIDAVDSSRSISKREATRLVAQMTGAFQPGSTVCVHLPNDVSRAFFYQTTLGSAFPLWHSGQCEATSQILYTIITLAILASGGRWTGSNYSYKSRELEHHFRISETKAVITRHDHLHAVRSAVEACGAGIEVILFSDILHTPAQACTRSHDHHSLDDGLGPRAVNPGSEGAPRYRNLHSLMDHRRNEATLHAAVEKLDAGTIALLMSTSGTTGLPKMACRTHHAVMQETQAIEDNNALKPYPVRRLFCTPIFHGFSAPEMLFNSIRLGLPTYFMERFDDDLYPRFIHDYEITETAAPPPMILRLVRNPDAHHLIQKLRAVYTGGATLVPEMRNQFLDLFPDVKPRIVPIWGMTEGGWFTMLKFPEKDSTASVGRCIPGCEVKVHTRGKKAVWLSGDQLAGSLYVRSSCVMTGYLHDDAATSNALHDGWLETGDIGYVRDDKVFLVDREKDIVKVNGFQVSPAELENVLFESADVNDAAVISAGQDVNEHPLAFVIPAHEQVTERNIRDHLSERLASIKVDRCEIRFTDHIPKSASGKILKTELREAIACSDKSALRQNAGSCRESQ